MKRAILDLLQGNGDNYILPFFWQHGEPEAVLREYMGAIQDCGIGAVEGQDQHAVRARFDLPVAEAESIETGHRHHVRRAMGRGLS